MERQPLYRRNFSVFILIGLRIMIVNLISIKAHDDATALLTGKKDELKTFVSVVEANSRNCTIMSGCSNSGDGCSRLACYEYGNPDQSNYKCLKVFNYSGLCGTQCLERNFDYSKAYVRVVDINQTRTARTVCTHRNLDDHFKNSSINNMTHFFRAFFGAADGTFRIYPGADESCNDDYDPRTRPWYIKSTSIPKVVTVLLDSGIGMRLNLTQKTETFLDKAKKTALKILETLQEGMDFVNIRSFDGDANSLKPLNATFLKYKNATECYQSFNKVLDDIVSNEGTYSSNSGTSLVTLLNTSNAINATISELDNHDSNYLKVLILLTGGGQFQTLSQLNIPANSSVNLFVYKFQKPDEAPECNSSVRTFSTGIPDERIDNPLYAMESYYSFLANVHKSWHGDINISYSPRYPDHSGVDNNTMTLSKAAFGPSGKLLGVVGIDIFENKVNEQFAPDFTFEDITKAATSEDGNQNLKDLWFDTHTNLTVSVCFEPSDPPLCPHPDTSGLCQEKRGNSKIGCCGKCNTKINWGKIVGIVAAGIVGFVVIAVIVYFIWRCITRKMEDERVLAESPRFTFPGPENGDTILQGDTRENSEPRTGG